MPYFCFIESRILSVPHMEPLAATTVPQARDEARVLLSRHDSGYAAHVFLGDERIHTIAAEKRAPI